jgi:alcohol dehydrogenase class IV
VIFGSGSIDSLTAEVQRLKCDKVLVVTDKVMVKTGIASKAVTKLAGIESDVFDDVEAEPRVEIAEAVTEKVRKSECDLVVGVGGGSVLDMAKLAAGTATNYGEMRNYIGFELFTKKPLPSIMIPTTSGTGSELTPTSMVTVGGRKQWVSSALLMPTVAIVDPDLTISMPESVTASTGLDALCHCTEGYFSSGANMLTDSLALDGIRLVMQNLRTAYNDGQNLVARTSMSLAALLGGFALQARMVYGHSVGYTLASRFHLPHGVSCAIPLPYIIANYSLACAPKMPRLVEAYGLRVSGEDPVVNGLEIARSVQDLMTSMGIPTRISDLGAKEGDLQEMSDECLSLYGRPNSPVVFDQKSMLHFYKLMYTGSLGG